MVEVAAMFVVGQDVRCVIPGRRLLQRGNQLLLDAHPDGYVGRRVLVPAAGEAGDDERYVGQPAQPQVVQVLALTAARPWTTDGSEAPRYVLPRHRPR